ncbi:hypothetical protein AAMO2058_001578700 [Amorphochlora amoebiformis]
MYTHNIYIYVHINLYQYTPQFILALSILSRPPNSLVRRTTPFLPSLILPSAQICVCSIQDHAIPTFLNPPLSLDLCVFYSGQDHVEVFRPPPRYDASWEKEFSS